MLYTSAADWRNAERKKILLFGMSGLGKTHISNQLRDTGEWFHYSIDYRIGTRPWSQAVDAEGYALAPAEPAARRRPAPARSDACHLRPPPAPLLQHREAHTGLLTTVPEQTPQQRSQSLAPGRGVDRPHAQHHVAAACRTDAVHLGSRPHDGLGSLHRRAHRREGEGLVT